MLTDPARARREDPGNPDVCNLYPFHKIYSPKAMQDEIATDCRTAKIGCGECKKMLSETMLEGMKPMMEKRQDILTRPDEVKEILRAGTLKAHAVAKSTLAQAKQAMKLK